MFYQLHFVTLDKKSKYTLVEEDSEDESGAFASGIGALEAEADEEDDDDSVDMLVQDADYIPGATNERAIVEPIPVFFWRKV